MTITNIFRSDPMKNVYPRTFSHIGISVCDLDRAVNFIPRFLVDAY